VSRLGPPSISSTSPSAADLPYLRRRGGDAEELKVRGMPLGLVPEMSYEEKEIMLYAGEAALFYCNGLVEAHALKVRCSASLDIGHSCQNTVRSNLWWTSIRGARLLCWGRPRAGESYYPPYAAPPRNPTLTETSVNTVVGGLLLAHLRPTTRDHPTAHSKRTSRLL
jgi:stage II sporulation SpoE-like protein